ncbi:LYR motif-containing protein 1-like [Oppia nitens]|uniref:LYR motif-containing protein 1-like n=1 Tax=Oppia nitens TaxID=1686743 RepID=UPI0023DBB37E|nr:LYR motif-containing protein 1-like [Oppia nitens]
MNQLVESVVTMSSRQQVLAFYKRVIRLSYQWKATNDLNTNKERLYIKSELRQMFDTNRHLDNEDDIRRALNEGINRVQVAKHYNIPYPRPVYHPIGSYAKKQLK